jgi:hypothetical protein
MRKSTFKHVCIYAVIIGGLSFVPVTEAQLAGKSSAELNEIIRANVQRIEQEKKEIATQTEKKEAAQKAINEAQEWE